MFSDMSNSIPGVDEAMSFAELMKMVQNMNFSCIVFDTAPTGHTLRLLSFPTIMDKALSKLMDLKNKFSGLFSQFGNMFGGGGVSQGWGSGFVGLRGEECGGGGTRMLCFGYPVVFYGDTGGTMYVVGRDDGTPDRVKVYVRQTGSRILSVFFFFFF